MGHADISVCLLYTSAPAFNQICRRLGWVKDGDLKLSWGYKFPPASAHNKSARSKVPGVYSPYRKPLILKGVRQVGKTWILKEFGKCYYENTAYFNFDENEEYKQFFETTKDVDRILQNLMLASGQKIMPEKTLIIFDEVQDCPKVINSMKYFCENAPQYHIACAGSLLGIALAKPSSFPVGKVNFMQIEMCIRDRLLQIYAFSLASETK